MTDLLEWRVLKVHSENQKKEISSLHKSISDLNMEKSCLTRDNTSMQEKLDIKFYFTEIKRYEDKNLSLRKKIRDLENSSVDQLKATSYYNEQINKLQQKIQELQLKIEETNSTSERNKFYTLEHFHYDRGRS